MSEVRATISSRAKEELIIQMVLEHEADQRSIVVSPEEIEKTKKSLPLPPGQTLEQALAEQSVTMERLEADLSRALKIRALLDQAVPEAELTEEKVKEFYDSNPERFSVQEQATARHILIQIPQDSTDAEKSEKKAKAEGIRKELIDGGNFDALAKEHSEDPGSKDNGGVYTFPRGQMVKPFEDAAFDRAIDEIGPLVETQFGFHIIQTLKRDPARTISAEEAGPRIREMMKNEGRQQAIQNYVRDLRQKANVVIPSEPAQ
jgi:peptidyl-prolyl cis-trans isomerase C